MQAQIFAWIINVLNQIKTESSQNVFLLVIINKQCRGKTLKYFFLFESTSFLQNKTKFYHIKDYIQANVTINKSK